jgi:hypothetical protein
MIETVGDLIKLLHRYPSATRISVGNDCDDTAQLNGGVLNVAVDEIVLLIAPLPDDSPSRELPRKKKKKASAAGMPSEAEEALNQCDHILELCDEVPEKGEDFAESVREKVESIAEWIRENEHVTDAQKDSLNNMERGVSRWIR